MFLNYMLGLTATASLLMAWFMSDLPVHVFHVLRRLGWKRHRLDFWSMVPEDETTRQDFFDAVSVVLNPPIPYLLVDLLTCRICLSFHIAFWMASSMYLFTDMTLAHAALSALSWPIAANMVMSAFKLMLKEEEQ